VRNYMDNLFPPHLQVGEGKVLGLPATEITHIRCNSTGSSQLYTTTGYQIPIATLKCNDVLYIES
jgi:hypothetical protein